MRKGNRRGEVAVKSGAPLLIIITLLIVMYLILLPPEDRAALLGDDTGDSTQFVDDNSFSHNNRDLYNNDRDEFVFAGPGKIDVASRTQYDHDIPSVHLVSSVAAEVLYESNPFVVEYSAFKHVPYQSTFSISNPQDTSNIIMSFNAPVHRGTLNIVMNGHPIFSQEVTELSVGPIALPKGIVLPNNIVQFDVDSPGWKFWSSNKYEIENLKVQGQVLDTSRQRSVGTFNLRADEVHALQTIKLRYVAECEQRSIGKLKAYINGNLLFDQVPDCGIRNVIHFDDAHIRTGTNTLEFELEYGSVIVDTIEVLTSIDEEANDVTYFFELDEDLFNFIVERDEVCGEIDGYCPDNCNEDVDKDCCFEEYTNAYWCDAATQNSGDRCVGNVAANTAQRCPSGYEDEDGDAHEDYEDVCGDDNDGECPAGCSMFYDKDCCLEDNSGRFWCDDVPVTGLLDVCKNDLGADSCRLCPEGYEGEDEDPSCEYRGASPEDEESELKSDFEVIAKFIFVDDDKNKEAEVIVNGYTTNFDTFKEEFEKDISRFVKDGSNYITIRPDSDFSLVEVRIDIDER